MSWENAQALAAQMLALKFDESPVTKLFNKKTVAEPKKSRRNTARASLTAVKGAARRRLSVMAAGSTEKIYSKEKLSKLQKMNLDIFNEDI